MTNPEQIKALQDNIETLSTIQANLLGKVKSLEERLAREIRRFDHLHGVVDECDLTQAQRRRMMKAWWGSDDE